MFEINEIVCPLSKSTTEKQCLEVAQAEALHMLRLEPNQLKHITLKRKSIDARKRNNVHIMLSVRIELSDNIDEDDVLNAADVKQARRIRKVDHAKASPTSFQDMFGRLANNQGKTPLDSVASGNLQAQDATSPNNEPSLSVTPLKGLKRPVVVGAGCAGLFAALTLAEAGLKPLLIEQGDSAQDRTKAVEHFNQTGELDLESNIQFGLGGAGTFSDGKLSTGTKNPVHHLILETFVEAGAPREILWDAKPHIGSDILPNVVTCLVKRIKNLGGDVLFRTRLIDIDRSSSGQITGISVMRNGVEERIATNHLILACGHSARAVFELLRDADVALERKTFAIGVRIEHLQMDINKALYGSAAQHPALGAAPYSLVTHLDNGRSLFSFCMCPGGEVVAAASEEHGVVTNGASKHARAGKNANAALLVNITSDDMPGTDPLAGMYLQRSCEQTAYELGGGAYKAPAQLLGDFLTHRPSTQAGRIAPTYPRGVTWTALDDALPHHVIQTLRDGIPRLDAKLRGYNDPEAVLTGVETRSSSPVTITRDRTACVSVNTPGLYPCGEGAGYAGGIMSAAADGIRVASAVIAASRPTS